VHTDQQDDLVACGSPLQTLPAAVNLKPRLNTQSNSRFGLTTTCYKQGLFESFNMF